MLRKSANGLHRHSDDLVDTSQLHDSVVASVADATIDLVREDDDYSLGLGKDNGVEDSLGKDDDDDSLGPDNGFDVDGEDE